MNYQKLFENRKADVSALKAFGFIEEEGVFRYRRTLEESGFLVTVTVEKTGAISAQTVDPATGDPYVLHLTDAAGGFIGEVRSAFSALLREIAETCYDTDVFREPLSRALRDYVKQTYGDDLLFLWEDSPDCGVWKRRDTGKWYGVIMTAPREKLGLFGEGRVEITNLHVPLGEVEALSDGKRVFPAFHMNKKHWISALVDGSVDEETLFRWIDRSYLLADPKRKK